MSFVIVVTPSDPDFRDAAHLDDLPEHLRADLLALRDEVSERFPSAEAIGETGALARRPEIEGVGVVIHPEVITRPLVVNAVMRYAAPRQLLVSSPAQGLVADPRERIDIDVHRRPTMAGSDICDHGVRGRPHGTLPWVTHELLRQLVGKLEVVGDRLELGVDDDRWFRFELTAEALRVGVADGPEVPLYAQELDADGKTAAADAGWAWARGSGEWAGLLGGVGRAVGSAVEGAAVGDGPVQGRDVGADPGLGDAVGTGATAA
ncbi:hypothetical protein [Rhodococcus sp. IEGM 1408]|uniref:hypothetical protein n=1 Tax=Rhodococcus sp. IEGM 1408 TaxID=3082220 RepID=UPI002953D578|nr:hypothetical protein [Rhodococcus sp. IEGM 1408]MDV8001602.1 hypothetical protein [Rhodococcus sp. IEGM 1408]